jgi:hypothetical protein
MSTHLAAHQLTIAALVVFLASCSQYAGKEPIRHTEPVTIVGRYMGYACGDFCAQVKPENGFPDSIDVSWLETGLTFRVPDGFSAPDQSDELCVPHNLFELIGYYYFVEHRNTRFLHPRFDLIAWRPVLPFSVWRQNASGELPSHTTLEISDYRTHPDGWRLARTTSTEPDSFAFARKYDP